MSVINDKYSPNKRGARKKQFETYFKQVVLQWASEGISAVRL